MDNKKVSTRLRRIEGQVRGVDKMIAEGREFDEVITQLQALKSATGSLIMSLIEERLADEKGLTLTPEDAALILRLFRS